MTTGYEIREGAALIVARLLRDPENWPSQQEGSDLLRQRIAWARRAEHLRDMHSWLDLRSAA